MIPQYRKKISNIEKLCDVNSVKVSKITEDLTKLVLLIRATIIDQQREIEELRLQIRSKR